MKNKSAPSMKHPRKVKKCLFPSAKPVRQSLLPAFLDRMAHK